MPIVNLPRRMQLRRMNVRMYDPERRGRTRRAAGFDAVLRNAVSLLATAGVWEGVRRRYRFTRAATRSAIRVGTAFSLYPAFELRNSALLTAAPSSRCIFPRWVLKARRRWLCADVAFMMAPNDDIVVGTRLCSR